MKKLSQLVMEYVQIEGACAAGIATVKTLADGPPSADLTYVLPKARAAISFAIGIDQSLIAPYLKKQDRDGFEKEIIRANVTASGIALHLAKYLEQKGYPAVPLAANNVFRPPKSDQDIQTTADLYYPDISHRYLAVRSGIGHMGLSGNILTKSHGAAVILGGVVTTANLMPTQPLPEKDNYCDKCGLCTAACAAQFMDAKNPTTVNLGGLDVSYSGRRNYTRCDMVCSGLTGLSASGKWSTWSPGRFAIPKNDEDLAPAYDKMLATHSKWPDTRGGRYFFFMDDKLRMSCANCQFVCCPDKDERKARYKMLTESGVIVQEKDGTRKAHPPQKAREILAAMDLETRGLYEDV